MNLTERDTENRGVVFERRFAGWSETIGPLLDDAQLPARLQGVGRILIKPNLVEALDPPITTPVELVAALVIYLREKAPGAEVIVAEGSGAKDYETDHAFRYLGYEALARELGFKLVDLNRESLVTLNRDDCHRWPEMHLPEIVFDSFLLSVPVLKVHTLAGVTLTMKNMMGLAPPQFYQQGGHWKKASFHTGIQDAVLDLNRYRAADFTLLDATVGMPEAHLWGAVCDPPVNILAASHDPVAIDAYGANLLQRDWRDIGHIRKAHGELGCAEPLSIRAGNNK